MGEHFPRGKNAIELAQTLGFTLLHHCSVKVDMRRSRLELSSLSDVGAMNLIPRGTPPHLSRLYLDWLSNTTPKVAFMVKLHRKNGILWDWACQHIVMACNDDFIFQDGGLEMLHEFFFKGRDGSRPHTNFVPLHSLSTKGGCRRKHS